MAWTCINCKRLIDGNDFENGHLTNMGIVCEDCFNKMTKWECEVCGKTYDSTVQQCKHVRVPGGLVCPTCMKGLPLTDHEESFTKHDQEKIRLELIPPSLLKAVGTILTFGAKKYDDDNWRKCEKWSRYYGALMRHLNAFWDGEDLDQESGKPHLWHAGCCLAFLIEFQERGISVDDRLATRRKNETSRD